MSLSVSIQHVKQLHTSTQTTFQSCLVYLCTFSDNVSRNSCIYRKQFSLTVELHAEEGVIQSFGCSRTSTGELWHINIPVSPINPHSAEIVNAGVSIVEDIVWQWSGFMIVVVYKAIDLLKGSLRAAGVHCGERKFDIKLF